jgi:hypothetical protein
MLKNLIIVYTAGSCGDLVSIPWVATGRYYSVISSHEVNSAGRAVPVLNQKFLDQFPKQPKKHHYARDWSNDIDQLSRLETPFLILTTVEAQAQQIKDKLGDSVYVISINYSEDNWPFVASSFCSKVLDYPGYLTNSDVGENFLDAVAKDAAHRQQFLYLGKKGLLGYWYAKKLLSNELHYPPKEFSYPGDYTLELSDILNPTSFILELEKISAQVGIESDLEQFKQFYSVWIDKQNQLSDINRLFRE